MANELVPVQIPKPLVRAGLDVVPILFARAGERAPGALRAADLAGRVDINIRQLPNAPKKGLALSVPPVAVIVAEQPHSRWVVLQEPREKLARPRGAENCSGIRRAEAAGVLPGKAG